MKFFEDMTEEECLKKYGFSKEEMRLIYNEGKSIRELKEENKDE